MSSSLHDITFPDKYDVAAAYADRKLGNIETADIPDVKKLALYALRQHVEKGPCTEAAPYMWNVKERYKHQAWKSLEKVSKFEAMVKYVEQLEDVIGKNWVEEALKEDDYKASDVNDLVANTTSNESFEAKSPTDPSAPTQPPSLATSLDNNRSGPLGMHSPQSEDDQKDPEEEEEEQRQKYIHAPMPGDVNGLQAEVRRLRALLVVNGIDPETGRRLPERKLPQVRRCQPFPDPPKPPLTPPGLKRAVETPRIGAQAVYYAQPKIGWLEWLGLGGGGSEHQSPRPANSGSSPSRQQGKGNVTAHPGSNMPTPSGSFNSLAGVPPSAPPSQNGSGSGDHRTVSI